MSFLIARSPKEWAARAGSQRSAVATIGNFDGVHLGHQKILRGVVKKSRAAGALAVAVTFDPHPLRVLRPTDAPPLIETLEQRLAALEALGLDAALVLPFDRALSELSPEEFVRSFLVETLHASEILVGSNFRFGHRQAGDAILLRALGSRFGFGVESIAPVICRNTLVSSTAIRRAVAEGRVGLAARWLGRAFCLEGQIRPGTGQGRRLVVPTLNLETPQELLPKTGVYATETCAGGKLYRSATNVGYRPTFDGKRLTIECHLFGFSQELKAGPLAVRFWRRLRDEAKFDGPEALKNQVMRDLEHAREFFHRLDRYRIASGGRAAPASCEAGPSDFK
jgi:riboflavin kinase / FMN adenylyltransferase